MKNLTVFGSCTWEEDFVVDNFIVVYQSQYMDRKVDGAERTKGQIPASDLKLQLNLFLI